ncbi:Uncharacterised protein g10596 [Pycnogonum litorale]
MHRFILFVYFGAIFVQSSVQRTVDRREVSLYSKPVYVQVHDKIIVDGYASKLGFPSSSRRENFDDKYDVFVESSSTKTDEIPTDIRKNLQKLTSASIGRGDGQHLTALTANKDRTVLVKVAHVQKHRRHPSLFLHGQNQISRNNLHLHRQITKRTTTTTTSSPGLPECTTQQVCNALYVRLNRTQNLCSCPTGVYDKCSTSLSPDDGHSVRLIADNTGKILTMVKTCEPIPEVRVCKGPTDWALLAIQNMRTAKAHYLVICRCPKNSRLYGPTLHPNPSYARIPGINMYGMLCVQRTGRSVAATSDTKKPIFPWKQVQQFISYLGWGDKRTITSRSSS